ncbi:MAG: hypothetical protein WAN43_02735 [Rhodomicrobium sp.]|jgi:hypothetical protein
MRAFILAALLMSGAAAEGAPAKWGSVYTGVAPKDCIEIAKTGENTEGDFYEAECASYGGYRLRIGGSDLRYHPNLQFGGEPIQMSLPGSFHDMGSDYAEWLYSASREADGGGALEWRALIFRLKVSNPEGGTDRSVLYVVRLNGPRSCLLGEASSNDEARALGQNLDAPCQ